MKIRYTRASTREQNTIRQEERMTALGVEQIFIDRMSGKNTSRPELQRRMDFVRRGGYRVVESISRFARNSRDLPDLAERLRGKGVRWKTLRESPISSLLSL